MVSLSPWANEGRNHPRPREKGCRNVNHTRKGPDRRDSNVTAPSASSVTVLDGAKATWRFEAPLQCSMWNKQEMHSVHHMQKTPPRGRRLVTPVQVGLSFFTKVLPPAAKLARLFDSQPSSIKPESLLHQTLKLKWAKMWDFQNRDSLSKACRNNSWSAWMCCRFGFLAAAIAAEDAWYKPLALPPDPNPTGGVPAAEFCFCGAIVPQKRLKASGTPPDSSPLPLSKQKKRVWSKQPVRKSFSLRCSSYEHSVKVSV